jgi:hypothetical protein
MKITLIFALLLIILPSIQAQQALIEPTKLKHRQAVVDGWTTSISPEAKTTKKAWKQFVKDTYQAKVNGLGLFSNKDILTAEDVMIPTLKISPVDLYFKAIPRDSLTEISLFAYDSSNQPINDQSHSYQGLEHLMHHFLKNFLVEYHQQKINASKSHLEDMIEQTDDIEEEIVDHKESIQEMEDEIENLQYEIQELESAYERTNQKTAQAQLEIERRKKRLQQVRSNLKKANQ